VIGISASDINDWLKSKYTNVSESKFVLSEKAIKSFQKTYLDFYNDLQQDIVKVSSASSEDRDQLDLAVKSNPSYQDALIKLANKELDIETIMAKMAINVETRMAQVFDEIMEDPRNINTKVDRLFVEYADILGNLLDKYHKWKEKPAADQVVQHNITLQVVDQQMAILHDAIRETLSHIDLDSSQLFLELFNDKLSRLKMPSPDGHPDTEMKLAEAKILNETISQKINEG